MYRTILIHTICHRRPYSELSLSFIRRTKDMEIKRQSFSSPLSAAKLHVQFRLFYIIKLLSFRIQIDILMILSKFHIACIAFYFIPFLPHHYH